MDLDAAAEQLYRLAPEEFMAARTALVESARKAGDRPLASAIGALRRPTRAAWLVNLLAREAPDEVARLGELAGSMADAHAGADLERLRELGAQRHRLIDELTRLAVACADARGYQATEAVRAEVTGTLGAAVADPVSLTEVRAGRVVKALVYSGFGFPVEADSATISTPAAEAAGSATPEPSEDSGSERRAEDERRAEEERAVAAGTEALLKARAGLQAAEAASSAAAEALDRASQEVADLRAELRRAEQDERAARQAATQAADDVHDAGSAVAQAEQALADGLRAARDRSR